MSAASRRLLVLAALVLGVGSADALANGFGGSDSPPARIPVPAHDYRAIVEDASGTRVECTQITYDGEVFLYGNYGEGQVTVPFDKVTIARIEPSDTEGKKIAFVTMKDGTTVRFVIDGDTLAYGKTAFGTYSIAIERVRSIEILGDTPVTP